MTKHVKTLSFLVFLSVLLILGGCETNDPGPIQDVNRDFTQVDFDRLEMGSALHIRVEQSNTFRISANGDRRNIDELNVYKTGSTLNINFKDNRNRQHETYITINMPRLKAVNFSGASVSKIVGFNSDESLDFYLSGASECQLDAGYRQTNIVLSGASTLLMYGLGDEIEAQVSGASVLTAFDYPVREASINVSGASSGKITVTDELNAVAEGASSVLYRGNPSVTSAVSGASSVQKD